MTEIMVTPKLRSCGLRDDMIENTQRIRNIYEIFSYSVDKYSSRNCLGVRRMFGENKINFIGMAQNNPLFENCYDWKTFREIKERVIDISDGL